MTLLQVLEHPVIEALGWSLLHFVWQGVIIGVVLAVLLRGLSRQSANVRYLVLCAGLGSMAVLPPLMWWWLSANGDHPVLVAVVADTALVANAVEPVAEVRPASMPAEHVGDVIAEVATVEPMLVMETVAAQESTPGIERTWIERCQTLIEPALPWLVAGWLLGVLILSIRLLSGWQTIRRLRRQSLAAAPPVWIARMERLGERLRISRPVRLVESALVEVPTVIGWLKPMILLPLSAVTRLEPAQLEALLAHELAHIRRHDYLVNLLQTVIETLLFYHPAVWWVSRRIREEREHCCDDIAAEVCGDKVTYVRALALMEELRATPQLALAASGGSLLERIRRLVAPAPDPRRSVSWIAVLMVLTAVVSVGVVTCAPPPDPTAEKNEFEVELPDGGVVEFVGYVKPGYAEWFRPDGSPMPTPPEAAKVVLNGDDNPKKKLHGFLIRYRDLPDGRDVGMRIEPEWRSSQAVGQQQQDSVPGYYLSFPDLEFPADDVIDVIIQVTDLIPGSADVRQRRLIRFEDVVLVGERSKPARVSVTPERYVASLPDGISVEFVGITKNTASTKDAWRPDGHRLWRPDALGNTIEWPEGLVLYGGHTTGRGKPKDIPVDADARDYLFEFRGLKRQPSLSFDVPGDGASYSYDPLQDPYRLRISTRTPESPATGKVRVGLTDEAWGPWLQINKRGEISTPMPDDSPYKSHYDMMEIVRVGPNPDKPDQIVLEFRRPNPIGVYAYELRIVDVDGHTHNTINLTSRRSTDSELDHEVWSSFSPLAADRIDHFEYRLRPYQHWVTFDNVALQPARRTDVKVSHRTLSFVADLLPDELSVELVGLRPHGSDRDRIWLPDGSKHPDSDNWFQHDYINFVNDLPGRHVYAIVRFEKLAAGQNVLWRFPEGMRYIAPNVSNSPAIKQGHAAFLEAPEDAAPLSFKVGITDVEWGPVQRVEKDGTILQAVNPQARGNALYGKVGVELVQASGTEGRLTQFHWKGLRRLDPHADFELQAVDTVGQRHSFSGTAEWGEAEPYLVHTFELPPSQIDHFEYRLRPYRHWVAFDNVALQPGANTNVQIRAETLPQEVSREDQRVLDVLQERTDLVFTDVPFSDVVQFLRDYHQFEIRLDPTATAVAKNLGAQPINMHVNAETLETALPLLLHPAPVSFYVANGELVIASIDEVKRRGYQPPTPLSETLAALNAKYPSVPWEPLLLGLEPAVETEAFNDVKSALSSDDPEVQRYAALAASHLKERQQELVPALTKLSKSPDLRVRWTAFTALVAAGRDDFSTLPLIIAAWRDGDSLVRGRFANLILGYDQRVYPELEKDFPESSSELRQVLVRTCVYSRNQEVVGLLRRGLTDQDADVRQKAVRSIPSVELAEALLSTLQPILDDSSAACRILAAGHLVNIAGDSAQAHHVLLQGIDSTEDERSSALRQYRRLRAQSGVQAVAHLNRILATGPADLRPAAFRALAEIHDRWIERSEAPAYGPGENGRKSHLRVLMKEPRAGRFLKLEFQFAPDGDDAPPITMVPTEIAGQLTVFTPEGRLAEPVSLKFQHDPDGLKSQPRYVAEIDTALPPFSGKAGEYCLQFRCDDLPPSTVVKVELIAADDQAN